jgi:hypothetical protein
MITLTHNLEFIDGGLPSVKRYIFNRVMRPSNNQKPHPEMGGASLFLSSSPVPTLNRIARMTGSDRLVLKISNVVGMTLSTQLA